MGLLNNFFEPLFLYLLSVHVRELDVGLQLLVPELSTCAPATLVHSPGLAEELGDLLVFLNDFLEVRELFPVLVDESPQVSVLLGLLFFQDHHFIIVSLLQVLDFAP